MESEPANINKLEHERQQLHDLINKRSEKPLSNNTLLEQSKKLDDIIAQFQKEHQQKGNK